MTLKKQQIQSLSRALTEKNDKANKQLKREIAGEIRAVEDTNERTFILSFSSETPYERWFGTEILSHSDGACDLSRLNDTGCVLFNHDRDKVLAKIVRVWIENNRGMAEIVFDDDEFAEKIRKKVANKTLKGVSVGYFVEVWEEVAANKRSSDGRFTGPCSIATKWVPYEISIVSVPADNSVGVGREIIKNQENKSICGLELAEAQIQINKNKIKIGGM